MDELLSYASTLAEKPAYPINAPIQGRIAYVVSHGQTYASNGYAIRTQGIAQALNQHGFETLCFVRPGRPWELHAKNKVAPESTIEGVRYIHTRWQNDKAPVGNKERLEANVKKYVELFKVYRPSAVLAASNHAVGLPAWIAAKHLGLPFYNEVRGFWELSRAAREAEYKNTAAFKLEAERDAFVAKRAQTVFTLSKPMKDELVKRGVKASNIALVPNGVSQLPNIKPVNPALKKKLGITDDEKVIGYIGSFSAYEGLEVLLDACTQLVAAGEKLKLLLVGDDQPITTAVSDSNEQDSNEQVGKAEQTRWLIQVGRVPHDQVAEYYALIDSVVIPRKPLAVCKLVPPMKAAEALAHGKRLVVSDVAPLAEYADKYEGVVSFEAGSAASLATALQGSLKQPAPKPSTELLFSAYTEPMVRTLKGEGSAQVQKVAVEAQAKPTEPTKPQAETQAPTKAATATPVKKAAVEPKAKAQTKPTHKPAIKLTREVTWQRFDLNGDNVIRILGNVSIKNGGDKAGVLLVELFDKDGKKISPDEIALPQSEVFGGSFMYLQHTEGKKAQIAYLEASSAVSYVRLGAVLFHCKGNTKVEVSDLEVKAIKFSPSSEKKLVSDLKKPSDFKVAIIADEFTYNSFCQEFEALPIEPGNWLDVFQDKNPDVFFCESAWSGVDSARRPWKGRVYTSENFRNENRKDLFEILDYCKKAGIPTVFWNKEDPTHHHDLVHNFVDTAKNFDYVFTTAGECVESYKRVHGIKNVFALPFATNPRLFNPVEEGVRSDHAVFAGSWYANHENRSKVMESILDGLVEGGFKLDLYDRFYDDDDPLHSWPEKYKKFLNPSKPHHEMPGVYKSSKFGLNFNTVTKSPTMFARRVFELMSSNTLVVSNYSKGVDEMFGDLVVFPDRDPKRIKSLTSNEVDSLRHKALHEVLEKHTYKQRWRSILKTIGLPFVESDTALTFIYIVKKREEALAAISWYQQYGMQFSGSRLLLVADISMEPLDVAKLYQEFNRYGVSVTSALHAERYAMVDRYRPVETSHFVALRPGMNADAERIKEGALHLQYMTEHLVALKQRSGQRYIKEPAGADAVVMGSASQFTDWLKHQAQKQSFTAYWV
ncbi:glycosyltransferase [Halomonas alkaliantarctica]|uniref:glycosyltransferase n=1 Tax=Halomonas alkaliantarctica TaxID=232346 RepID=UPI0004AB6BD9|nr:glycosyltransferase [Halomonas alkaliantarctica]